MTNFGTSMEQITKRFDTSGFSKAETEYIIRQTNTIDSLLTCGHVTTDIGCCSKLPEEGCKRKGYPTLGQTQHFEASNDANVANM